MKIRTRSENEQRYARLRLGRLLGNFLLRHALTLYLHSLWGKELRTITGHQCLLTPTQEAQAEQVLAPYRSLVRQRILDYLRSPSPVQLHLEGFLNFRLKELRLPLARLAYEVVDEMLYQQETESTLLFLENFRRHHGAGHRLVHCYYQPAQGMLLCDREQKELAFLPPEEILPEEGPSGWLVSTLLLLGAEEVILHRYSLPETLASLLSRLFRLKKCRGCVFCQSGNSPLKANKFPRAKEP
ncbi:sporulation protein YtxC [Desulfothermobacter acidiphilus]|uniref:sporulation protein YtxC n=1 Tax=Desulfothermobacter acidiphilus TaxID=1938353 RepID=UPI003F8953B4